MISLFAFWMGGAGHNAGAVADEWTPVPAATTSWNAEAPTTTTWAKVDPTTTGWTPS